MLGLRCFVRFCSCNEQGLLFVAVHRLMAEALGTRASVDVACGLSSCSLWAYLLPSMWNLPGPGIESMFPVGRRIPIHWATGKPPYCLFKPQLWFPDSVEGYVNANTSFEYWKAFHLKHKYSRSVNLPPCCLGSSHVLVTTFWKLESKEKLEWDLCKQNWHIWQIFNNTVCDGLHTWMHGSKWKWVSCKALGNIKKFPMEYCQGFDKLRWWSQLCWKENKNEKRSTSQKPSWL